MSAQPRPPYTVRAVAPYKARNNTEVSLVVGKVYRVLLTDGRGLWWQAKKEDGLGVGWFPASYTKVLEEVPTDAGDEKDHTAKVLFVGDPFIGKTMLVQSCLFGKTYQGNESMDILECYRCTAINTSTQETFTVRSENPSGDDEADRLRPLCYPQTNLSVVCFSMSNPSSLQNVSAKWIPEVSHYLHNTPVLLVGIQSDKPAGRQGEGEEVARKMNVMQYLQVDLEDSESLRELFSWIMTVLTPVGVPQKVNPLEALKQKNTTNSVFEIKNPKRTCFVKRTETGGFYFYNTPVEWKQYFGRLYGVKIENDSEVAKEVFPTNAIMPAGYIPQTSSLSTPIVPSTPNSNTLPRNQQNQSTGATEQIVEIQDIQ